MPCFHEILLSLQIALDPLPTDRPAAWALLLHQGIGDTFVSGPPAQSTEDIDTKAYWILPYPTA